MSTPLPRHTGSCLCGGVRYELTAELGPIEVCYCRMCRKASGGPLATNALSQLRLTDLQSSCGQTGVGANPRGHHRRATERAARGELLHRIEVQRTLAPWSPPRYLVTSGPYRWSRNPMYIGVVTILVGWWLLWDSRTLLTYTLAVACVFYVRVLTMEELWAARHFGAEWETYRANVPRWIGTRSDSP